MRANATEVSGLAVSRQSPKVFWIHNDGDRDRVFALNGSGELLATYQISRALSDFEDIAIGPGPDPTRDYLYFGDIGSNSAVRNKIRIYRALEPKVDPAWVENPKTPKFSGGERFRRCDFRRREHAIEFSPALAIAPVSLRPVRHHPPTEGAVRNRRPARALRQTPVVPISNP